ncbi:hypothetical protein [Vibrio mediterranei]|uniref:hypothetical protein n=1 Tax=Vibrio mediterranei TaxID=689 RepID=UPI00148BDAD6|nr:hypothetical protein [Vibrio mediterranei]NOI26467.1 hypothetical protein [Vibrio mediterranei]
MDRIFAQIELRSKAISSHKLFSDIERISVEEVPDKMKVWAPLFIHLTMTFRDINQMFYISPEPCDIYQQEINAHARIDSTHWHFLLDDLKVVGADDHPKFFKEHLNLIWSDTGAPIRQYMYALIGRAQSCGDSPFLRATVMESGEATVKLFFATTRLMAKRFKQATGKTLKYFGDDHLRSEVENPVDKSVFDDVVLDNATVQIALNLVDAHFDKFKDFLDAKYAITFGREPE